ncbi:MAG TPA: hypothetical protein VFJ85_06555 [Acidimicrobiales bacterium]|nr:hypothetical protein [Acidimicrobiales bacterium]
MDTSVVAAFVALALLIPLVALGMALRFLLFTGRLPPRRPRRPLPPLGGDPYHLP